MKAPRSQAVLPSSSKEPPSTLKIPLALLKIPVHQRSIKICTQFDTLHLYILQNIGTWYLSLLHHEKLKKVLAQLTQKNPPTSLLREGDTPKANNIFEVDGNGYSLCKV